MKPNPIRHLLAALLLGSILPATAADQTATWNGTTGNWSDFTKWSTNPNFANNGNGGFTYDAIQSVGTVTVNQAITIEKYNLSGGNNTGTGFTLTMNDLLAWTDGTISGSGTINANGGATLSGGNKQMQGSRVVNLGGTSTWSAGLIDLYFGAVIGTTSGGTLTNTFSGDMRTPSDTGGTFSNAGTFTKNTSSGTTTIRPTFNNTGIVNVDTGTLLTNNGGTSTGAWNVASGATLTFDGGTHNLNAGSTFSGAGTVSLTSGTMTVNGATSSSASTLFSISGGSFNGTGTLTVNGPLSWTGATISGVGTFNSNGGATLSGGLKTLASAGRVMNLSGTSTWSAGGIDLYFTAVLTNTVGGTLTNTFSGEMRTPSDTGGTFNNAGTFTKNTSSGTTTIQTVFNNTGIVNVDTGTLIADHGGTSTGAWNVASGATVTFAGRTQNLNAGTTVNAAGTLGFSGGITNFNAGTLSVTGNTQVNGGTANFNAAASTNLLTLSSGVVGGTGTFTVSGATTFSGGNMTGAGITQANGGVTFSGSGDKNIDGGRVVNLTGSSTWTGGRINVANNAQLVVLAGATLDTSIAGNITNALIAVNGTFTVQGTFNKSGATTVGLGTGGGLLTFNNTGVVNVSGGTLSIENGFTQHSGTTLTGGTWNVTNGASISRTAGSNITTIGSGATVMLDGAGSSFAKVTNTLATNQGSLTLKNNRDLTTAGAYANSGTTRVEDSTTVLTVNGAYTQTGGVTAMVGGAFIDPTVFNLNGGTLQGTGTIQSNVIAGPGSHTIAPGLSPGTLTINGSLTLSSGSTLAMEMGGLTQGILYDHLDVNGVLTLAGMLDLDFINDFQNSLIPGNILTLATADSAILGSFGNVASGSYLLTNFPIALQVFYGAGSPFGAENLVVIVPEPSRALLMMMGGMAVLHRRRRSMARPA